MSLRERAVSIGKTTWEIVTAPDRQEAFMNNLGCIEILPAEKPWEKELKWSGYLARTTLRLGEGGRFIFDPKGNLDPTTINQDTYTLFKQYISSFLTNPRHYTHFEFTGNTNHLYFNGMLRRITGHVEYKRMLKRALKADDDRLKWLYLVMERETVRPVDQHIDHLPSTLIVAHKGHMQSHGYFQKAFGTNRFLHPIAQAGENITNSALAAAAWPYIGAAVVTAEAVKTGRIGKTEIIDYHDCLTPETDTLIDQLHPKYVLLTGALTYDVASLPKIVEKFRQKGARVIIGGVITSLDPEVLVKTTRADLFIGEAEGAMDVVFDTLENADPHERFVFQRVPMSSQHREKTYVFPDQEAGYTNVFINGEFVDIPTVYSPEIESAANLANRLRYQMFMEPDVALFERAWESPIHGVKQIEISRGCPWGCGFCSTVESQGTDMRRKTVEELTLEMSAIESPFLIAVDQNFGAIGRNETPVEWYRWMQDFFSAMKAHGKKLACQSELAFFDRIEKRADPAFKQLISEILVAVLGGLENAIEIRGISVKQPEEYGHLIRIAHDMGVVIVGTAIAGIPERMLKSHTDSLYPVIESYEELIAWLAQFEPYLPIVFPFQ